MGHGRPEDQPLPVENDQPFVQDLISVDLENMRAQMGETITDLMLAAVEERRALGEQRYKVKGLQPHNGRDMLRDAFEELLDSMVYLRAVCMESGSEADMDCYSNITLEAMYIGARIWRREHGDASSEEE